MYKIEHGERFRGVSQIFESFEPIWSPFQQSQQQMQLASQKNELTKLFNQMYFPDDKLFHASKLLPLIYKQLNARPFSKQLWLELLDVQKLARSDSRNRMWSAETAMVLGGWENRYEAMVGLICLEQPARLVIDDRAFCERRLDSFSTANTRRSLSLLGFDMRSVDGQLAVLKTYFCLFCE